VLFRSGRGLAAGDFDGDGVDDLAVGIPGLDTMTDADVGGVWIYRGLDGVGISLAPYIMLDQADCGATVEAGDEFGYTLCAGDMGGDGFADLFVGSIGEDNDAGLVGYFRGSAGGITPAGSGFAKQSGLGGVDDTGARFGLSLALGDFIDDDNLDLAIGAPYGDSGSQLDIGKVYIVRGTSAGPVATGGEILTSLSLNLPVQLSGAFGWSLAAGRFLDANGDRPDLAIGEPLYDVDGHVASGRVVIVDYDSAADSGLVTPHALDQSSLGATLNAGATFGWALAAGNIMDNGGLAGPDDFDDLAIGAPSVDVPVPDSMEALFWADVGVVYLVPGSTNGFAKAQAKTLDAMERNDLWFDFDERMGASLAFGKFDDTGWDNLAIGVPRKNYPAFIGDDTEKVEAGQVYIMAPWRQPAGRPHRSSIVQDCVGRIMYAQRMGQRLTPASTTKALTALIAVEAIQNGDVLPGQLYTVTDWAAKKVTGSQFGLFEGEEMSFVNLIRTMIAVSGNDCSYTIGDILTGEDNVWDYNESTPWNLERILADFAVIMNNRAAQLGMSPAHTFNNPAGRPYGDHWSTATDLAIFVEEAMKNEMFRDIVGTQTWPLVVRWLPYNVMFPLDPPVPGLIPVGVSVSNGFYAGILANDARATGVKGGWNSISGKTGLYSAEVDNGYAKCTIFGVPPYGLIGDFAAELLSLVGTDCEPAQVVLRTGSPFPFADATHTNIPLDDAAGYGATAQLDAEQTADVCVEIFRDVQTTPTACLTAFISRNTDFDLAGSESRSLGANVAGNNLTNIELAIHNTHETTSARINVSSTSLGLNVDLILLPDESWVMPTPSTLPSVDGSDFVITNTATTVAELQVEQRLDFEVTLGQGIGAPLDWKLVLVRDGIFRSDVVQATVLGCDPADGNTVHLSIHPTFTTSAVGDDPSDIPSSKLNLSGLENFPNPFNPQTAIAFELAQQSAVSVHIYDLSGRLVKVLASRRVMAAGPHQVSWAGVQESGQAVSSGVYLVQVSDGQMELTQQITLLK